MTNDLAALIAAIFLSAVLQAGTGFGFSILATPLLLFFFPASVAIQVNMILSLLLCVAMFRSVRHKLDHVLLRRMLLAGLIALPFAVPLAGADGPVLRVAIGVLLLVLLALLAAGVRLRRTAVADYGTGAVSAFATIGTGMPGPPLLIYLAGSDANKGMARATALTFFIFSYIVGLGVHFLYNGTDWQIWRTAAVMAPVVLVGILAGQRLYRHLSQCMFRWLLYAMIAATAIASLVRI